jgi:hypothetical protein
MHKPMARNEKRSRPSVCLFAYFISKTTQSISIKFAIADLHEYLSKKFTLSLHYKPNTHPMWYSSRNLPFVSLMPRRTHKSSWTATFISDNFSMVYI